jgi:hypothetical protein
MTTQIEGKRLIEAYRLALCTGGVARYRENFRKGDVVQFRINKDTGFSDGLTTELRIPIVGQYQLRYYPQQGHYAVYGRLSSATDKDGWIPIEGPWKCGEGPFDRKRRDA